MKGKKVIQFFRFLTIVTPSEWLKSEIKKSFLNKIDTRVINNGIKLPEKNKSTNRIKGSGLSIIAVANYWTKEKGINEIKKILALLDEDIKVTIVGSLNDKDPVFKRCNQIHRTEDYTELENLYWKNDIFINLSLCETFPTVNIEALAHGLPGVTYNTGGFPEIIDNNTGIVVNKHDYVDFAMTINRLNQVNYLSRANN